MLRWGIIGCGDVCERKAGPPLYTLPHSQLIAVTRRDEQAGQNFDARHGPCEYVPSVEALCSRSDIDAIYVATPDALHHAGTLAAASKHVMVEKAMACNASERDDMIAACAQAKVVLAVAYYRRGYPSILAAKQLIAAGAIGTLRSIWINDQFPESHRIDLCHFLAGPIAEIAMSTEALWPDSCSKIGDVLRCWHHNGAQSTMGFAWSENHDVEKFVIDGDAGRIVIDDLKAGRMWLTSNERTIPYHQAPLPYTHWGLFANMIAHCAGEAALACDGHEGRRSTVILDTIAAAPRDGNRQTINYGDS